MITDFHGDHFFLSNFFPVEIVFEGDVYPTVEHAFQAAKTSIREQREAIRLAASPVSAKRLGRRVTLRGDWETVKFDIMLGFLRQKFTQPDLRQKLLETGDLELIEGNRWGDRIWGRVMIKGQWVGKNHLGQLLMQVRSEVRENQRPQSER